jgi:hypothetical protein
MKHLKKFNESSDGIKQTSLNLQQTIKDIFLDLTDDGYKISMREVESSDSHSNFGSPQHKITLIVTLERVESDYENSLGRTVGNIPFIFSECIDNFDRVYDYASSYGDVVTNQVGVLINNPNEHKEFNKYRYNNWGSFKEKLRKEYGLDTLVRFVTLNFTVILDT